MRAPLRAPDSSETASPKSTLQELALRHGTDKEGVHFYSAAYASHLEHLRDRQIRLLEIGVGGYKDPLSGGESLRMWKEYFPNAQIVGLDIYDKSGLAEERIAIVQGDQSDPGVLEDIGVRFGPFDVIIDDGSHISSHVIASFRGLFRYLKVGGIYAIEDLQTSYWEKYGGSSEEDRSGTSMTFLHGLVDGLNHAEFDVVGYTPSEFDLGIVAVTFHHNLAFIEKGSNIERSNFLGPHPRQKQQMRIARRPAPPRPTLRSRLRSRARRLLRRVRGR